MSQAETQFFNTLAQLEELMRLYRRLKFQSSFELLEKVRDKCNEKETKLKQNDILYVNIESQLKKTKQLTFLNTLKPPPNELPHIISQSSSSVKESSFSGIVFDNNSVTSIQKKKQSSSSRGPFFSSNSISQINKKQQDSSSKINSNNQIPHILASNSEQQVQVTNEASSTINNRSSIKEFLNNQTTILTSKLTIVSQVFKKLEAQTKKDKNVIFVFGVNFPSQKKVTKLQICTLYTISIKQLVSKATNCQDILKCFAENLREPIGIIIQGQILNDIQVQHLKLIQKLSVFPMIFILKSFDNFNGFVVKINSSALIDCNRSAQPTKIFNDKSAYEMFSLDKFQISKIGFTAKVLSSDGTNNIQQASKAFTIQQKNDLINDDQVGFSYKVPKDLLTKKHSYYQILFISNNGQITSRKKYQSKEFQILKSQALNCKQTCILLIQIGPKALISLDFMEIVNAGTNPQKYGIVCVSSPGSKFCSLKVFQIKPNITNQSLKMEKDKFTYQEFSKGLNTVKFVELIDKQSISKFQGDFQLQDLS